MEEAERDSDIDRVDGKILCLMSKTQSNKFKVGSKCLKGIRELIFVFQRWIAGELANKSSNELYLPSVMGVGWRFYYFF